MASLIPSGSASGTGSMTLLAPVTNSNLTVTLPAASGTAMVSGNMPAFSAYQNNSQTVNSYTATKVVIDTKEYDTANCFNTSTYQFTPTIAGYYQVNGSCYLANSCVSIYKNGTEYKRGTQWATQNASVSTEVYCNGSTDYLELYVLTTGTAGTGAYTFATFFNGSMVRVA
jgi:hypothetical protein